MRRACWCVAMGVALVAVPYAGADSAAGDDVVLRAMNDELPRAMKLKLADVEAPYYVAYRVTDVDTLKVSASLGALVVSDPERDRSLRVQLRVGDPSFDNSNFEDSRSFMSGGRPQSMPIEDDYDAIRWALWLASDDAYKAAAEDLEKKRAANASRTKGKDDVADFSTETPASIVNSTSETTFDVSHWEATAKAVSDVFSSRPEIYESSVTIWMATTIERFASTEGTSSRDQQTVARIDIVGSTQADDGMPLKHYVSFAVADSKDLPSEAELVKHAERLADELIAIRSAPVVEGYTGPVLFEGRAAAQLVGASLAPHLIGTPPPKSDSPSFSRRMGTSDTSLADQVGKRVAAKGLDIVDDPGTTEVRGLPVVGSYAFDAEGVAAQKVSLVANGILETFLMSRTPRKDIATSNGHARGGGYGPIRAQVANLIVSSKRGKSTKQLEGELLRRAKQEGYDYAIVVALLDDPSVTGMDRDAQMDMFMASARGADPAPPPPLIVYKLTKPGKREPVRGAMLGPVRVRDWRDVVVGKRYDVHSFSVSSLPGAFALMAGLRGSPASIVSPELLFPEVEVQASSGSKKKPPIVPTPVKAPTPQP